MKVHPHHKQAALSLLVIGILFSAVFAGGMTMLRAELLAIQDAKADQK